MASFRGRELVADTPTGSRRAFFPTWCIPLLSGLVAALLFCCSVRGQDDSDPLDEVHVATPAPAPVARKTDPALPLAEGASLHVGVRYRVDTNLVLIPLTVTDPMDRLVTGLEKQNFTIYEENHPQSIRTFSCDDAPVSVGVILDLSGSMSNKVVRAKAAILQFMKTSNPQD